MPVPFMPVVQAPSERELPPLDCSFPVSDVFKLLATVTSKWPECSSARIQDFRVTNLLPETYCADYFLGDVPECPFPVTADFDHWRPVEYSPDRGLACYRCHQCGDEEYLEMETGATR